MNNKMKILLIFISIFFACDCNSLLLEKHEKIPNNLNESFAFLDKMLDDTTKYTFMMLPEDVATSRLHFGFGRWMRNNWGLWGDGPLKQSLLDSGFVHPDDMSSVILKSYHRWLNAKPLRIREEAAKYLAYWKNQGSNAPSAGDLTADPEEHTSMKDLLKYFPVGDTIVVSIYATYDEEYAASVQGLAVVIDHIGDSLFVYLTKLDQKEDYQPERKAGETFKVSPYYCSLRPPKNLFWMKNR